MKSRLAIVAAMIAASVDLAAFGSLIPHTSGSLDERALMDAIAMVESERGATSSNIYQIRRIYFDDVIRITRRCDTYESVSRSRVKSEEYISEYWAFYANVYFRRFGRLATPEVLAKMHNGGGRFYESGSRVQRRLDCYWRRVSPWYEFYREKNRMTLRSR